MFDKKTIVVAFLSLGTVWGLQTLFQDWTEGHKAVVHQAGGAYKIPSAQDLSRPAHKTIDFAQSSSQVEAELVTVSTPLYQAVFSTFGASLDSLTYPQLADGDAKPMHVIYPTVSPEQAAFIVGLSGETPLKYHFDAQNGLKDGSTEIIFSARTQDWKIIKKFILHADSYVMDMALTFEARTSHPAALRPRIFMAAPRLCGIGEREQFQLLGHSNLQVKETINGVVLDADAGKMQQVTDVQRGTDAWVVPSLIGTESNYFANVLVKDAQNFTQRGYFTGPESGAVSAIIEGPAVAESSTYALSFYVGPKSLPQMHSVDARLEDLVGTGMLSWVAKKLAWVLIALNDFCHNYGLAIILLTLLLKLMLMPLSLIGARYMAAHQRLQPRIAALRKKYANDTTMFNTEVMRLYKEHNISPASMGLGCLFMLPQIPLFFAMYRLAGLFELYRAPFFGWITDITLKDPYYVLPGIAIILMLFQPFGAGDNNSALRYVMPLVFAAVFVSMPVSMLLFAITNFGISLIEQWLRKQIA